jgi:hypothetical protein
MGEWRRLKTYIGDVSSMATTMDAVPTTRPLEYLPVALFGSTMGLTGW